MEVLRKLGSFTIHASIIILLQPSVSSSLEQNTGNHTINNDNILKTLSVLLSTAGAILSVKNFNNSFSNHHQKIGVALYGIIWLQALIGFLRPHRGCKGRSVWFFAHWLLGTSVCLLGILNIYTGLQAYHEKTSRSIHLWTIIFTIQLSFMAFIYLLQDKWVYMQKQGVILGNEPVRSTEKEISTRNKLKVLTTETC
ncbi:hypothetical protein Q3G72_000797 [Acer saccharum]|nr:hypothetical protein Q3G72_000797 [Acer saccharum]